jgi:hypothetical protein
MDANTSTDAPALLTKLAETLLAEAPELLAAGYISEVSAHALADYWLEAQFASLDADEPGGADSWSSAECAAFYEATKAALQALGRA